MDGSDRELGWEDVGGNAQDNPNAVKATAPSFMGGLSGSLGSPGEGNAPLSDAVTSAMVSHFANEFTKGSLTFWPQFMQTSRQYFNVNHGYVLRKMLWLIVPMPTPKKKSGDGELGGEKDWSVRVFEGLEVEIEEPDMYIPVMSFVTYVLLCGLVRGLQEQFNPDFLSSTMTFSMVVLILEVTVAKAALFMAGVQVLALVRTDHFWHPSGTRRETCGHPLPPLGALPHGGMRSCSVAGTQENC